MSNSKSKIESTALEMLADSLDISDIFSNLLRSYDDMFKTAINDNHLPKSAALISIKIIKLQEKYTIIIKENSGVMTKENLCYIMSDTDNAVTGLFNSYFGLLKLSQDNHYRIRLNSRINQDTFTGLVTGDSLVKEKNTCMDYYGSKIIIESEKGVFNIPNLGNIIREEAKTLDTTVKYELHKEDMEREICHQEFI